VTEDRIRIRGARQNNLAGVDVDVPRGALVAVTGVSGSGKSSLAFDTLFREGQRRFLETLSAYARQFLGRMEKPDVDAVEGLSPAIAVDQRAIQRGPRSTVGTLTEIFDHLRVLYARAGTAHCPDHDLPLAAQTPEDVIRQVAATFDGQRVHVLAPRVRDRKGQHKALFEELARKGYVRVRVDGVVTRIEEVPELERYKRHTVEVVVDRLKVDAGSVDRLREAVHAALELGEGDVGIHSDSRDRGYSTLRTCSACGAEAPPLEPRLFSFNSPHGACARCDGLGVLRAPTEARVVRDPSLSIRAGALAVTRASGGALLFPRVDFRFLERVAEAHGFDLDTPWRELGARARNTVLGGTGDERFRDQSSWSGKRFTGSASWMRRYRGVIPALERAWRRGFRRKQVEKLLEETACPDCGGTRLNRFASAVALGGARIDHFLHAPIDELGARIDGLELGRREARIARDLLTEIRRRVGFLEQVGLGYLTLDRAADSLSGGEAQRIRLAAQLGAGLQGVLYVLDEPSIGLHPRDHGRLLDALRQLCEAGNSVVVVEHDEATLRAADYLIDVGPGAGRNGGRIVAAGSPDEVARADSPTAALLRNELEMPVPDERRAGNGHCLRLTGARGFNLDGLDVELPLGLLLAVTGVSGSGKSTLVNATLKRALTRGLGREAPEPEPFDALEGAEHVEELVSIDSAPIGRTPRSNPATYTGAFSPIRDLFSSLPEARMRGWAPGRFSFNVEGGRCSACQGAGAQFVELQFLAPVTVPCEECGGHRFHAETLEVRYRGHSIADVLALTIEEAAELFGDHPRIARPLSALVEVGLGYLTLGQPSTTLSGGEAQRVKLAKHLQQRARKHTLYLLDEPTTGLHQADVQRLVAALQRLVDLGHSAIVIEHNLDLVRCADWVVDLGPEGGAGGGKLVAAGPPEVLERVRASHTGRALRELERARAGARAAKAPSRRSKGRAKARRGRPTEGPSRHVRVRGARTHNLANVSVDIPRDALTVVTGPSGSGKSSLALDTIHALGRQRFVESLSTYARQFLSSRDKPPVDRIEGLGPSVAVEARSAVGHPRSTVATTTEIHDHLRVLWARAGIRRCPTHGEALERTSASTLARRWVRDLDGESGWILAPIFGPGAEQPDDLAAAWQEALEAWRSGGFARILWNDAERRLERLSAPPGSDDRIDLVIDRVRFGAEVRSRVAEAIEQAEAIGAGRVSVRIKGGERHEFSTQGACTRCGFRLEEALEPRHFSFNAHVGACPACDGLGARWQCDPDLLVDRPDLPLVSDGSGGPTAISGKLGRYLTKGKGYYEHLLRAVARSHRIDLARPYEELTDKQRDLLLWGTGARGSYKVQIEKHGARFDLEEEFQAEWPGLCGHVDGWHGKAEDPGWRAVLEQFMTRRPCRSCGGERLAPAPRSTTVGRKRLPELLACTVAEAAAWLGKLRLGRRAKAAVEPVTAELASRLALLERVGLGYLTLDRAMSSLSGGEARRVRLSASLGSNLVGVCYVLDEPTVGLHPRDVERLTDALEALRDGGNTVIVVEHDEALMERADHIVDMGPGAGRRGGQVVVSGTPEAVRAHPDSLTGKALRGELDPAAERGAERPDGEGEVVRLRGARLHNLRNLTLEARFGELLGVCGPSGSGKSTLVMESLVPALQGERSQGRWRSLAGARGGGRRVVVVDASPLGRTPASIPATAVGLMDPLRDLFTRTPDARMRGYTRSHFSFNGSKGRCAACEGRGAQRVEMQFLADLWLECEECDGRRYRPEVLGVRYRGKSIADVLDLAAEDALAFLEHQPPIARALRALVDVGLGYMPLGQSSTTLSAGEAQRVKLAAELLRAEDAPKSVVVLDEPTTGLHASDVVHLLRVLRRLADKGDCVIVIEHQTDLLRACDRLVELGPGGGDAGGRLIAAGTPAELAADPSSVTGPFLARDGRPRASVGSRGRRGGRGGAARGSSQPGRRRLAPEVAS